MSFAADPPLVLAPPAAEPSPTKTAAVLLFALASLLLAVGLASSWFFYKVDQSYSKLVKQTAADLNQVHDIAYHAGVSYASMASLGLARDPQARSELIRSVSESRSANDKTFAELQRSTSDPATLSCLTQAIARRAAFRLQSDTFIATSEQATSAELEASLRRLLQSFVDYQNACNRLADHIKAQSLELSEQSAKTVNRLRYLFFGLGVFPIIAAAGLVVLLAYLIQGTPVESDLH